jgi:hypothetical protein
MTTYSTKPCSMLSKLHLFHDQNIIFMLSWMMRNIIKVIQLFCTHLFCLQNHLTDSDENWWCKSEVNIVYKIEFWSTPVYPKSCCTGSVNIFWSSKLDHHTTYAIVASRFLLLNVSLVFNLCCAAYIRRLDSGRRYIFQPQTEDAAWSSSNSDCPHGYLCSLSYHKLPKGRQKDRTPYSRVTLSQTGKFCVSWFNSTVSTI